MKRTFLFLTGFIMTLSTLGQTDSTEKEGDTVRVGNILIIKRGDDKNDSFKIVPRRRQYKPSNVTTNWWIVDLGVSQFNDKTNYGKAISDGYLAAGANEDWFNLRNIKSTNVNIWVFMQKVNVIKHAVNLKYGLGVELNNYRFTEDIRFQKNMLPRVVMDTVNHDKNKLAADYVTVPIMLNFNFMPNRKHGFGFSAGVSAGYLYSSRQKFKSDAKGKSKEHDDFDLNKWKISYVGEVSLGPVRLYGSYATKSMFKKSLDFTPYNVGIRLSNW